MLSSGRQLPLSRRTQPWKYELIADDFGQGTGSNGAADFWGTKDMNLCCGRVNMKIPADIPAGDYLLRAEVVALHVAGSLGGAQLYMSCCMSPSIPSPFPSPSLPLSLIPL